MSFCFEKIPLRFYWFNSDISFLRAQYEHVREIHKERKIMYRQLQLFVWNAINRQFFRVFFLSLLS